VALIVFFIIINLVIWKFGTEILLTNKYSGGDLARMGYVLWAKYPRKNSCDLPKRHIEQEDYAGQPIKVLTIGDSFSNGAGGGKNGYYQDYIATMNNCNVLNIEPFKDLDPLTTTAILYNNHYLDAIHPKYLLISCSEKFCVQTLARQVDFSKSVSMNELVGYKRMGYKPSKTPGAPASDRSFLNNGNFKFLLYGLLYHFSDKAYFSKVYQVSVTEPLFSNTSRKKLLFFRNDVTTIQWTNREQILKINENLNRLADLLDKKGIKLYFMPCVDKYNLYHDYIVNKSYPKSIFFDELRKLPRTYTLIDTKLILTEELRKGEKDIFFADDTHWSWKAPAKIFDMVRFN
jgi:hypothetical protein